MLSNPRIGFGISLGVAAAAMLWLIGQLFASDLLWPLLSFTMHAVTLLAVFLFLTSVPAAFLFYQYTIVRADLLAGRNVVARWRVDQALFRSFSKAEASRDLGEKRSALYIILIFIAVIFGAIALFDPAAAGAMIASGATVSLVIVAAFFFGNRVIQKHLMMRSGEIIVGKRGLLVNDVLHVWGTFLSQLSEVTLKQGAHPTLTISYSVLARYGPQTVVVTLPFSPHQLSLVLEVKRQLGRRQIIAKA